MCVCLLIEIPFSVNAKMENLSLQMNTHIIISFEKEIRFEYTDSRIVVAMNGRSMLNKLITFVPNILKMHAHYFPYRNSP